MLAFSNPLQVEVPQNTLIYHSIQIPQLVLPILSNLIQFFQTQLIKAHSALKSLLKQSVSMWSNSPTTYTNDPNKKQSFPYFNELSISSIKSKNNPDQSLNFQNENQLFSQVTQHIQHSYDQYGLQRTATYRGSVKRSQDELPRPITFSKEGSNSRLKTYQFQQQNLCFNKQLRRKKIQSKSKQKMIQSSTQLSGSRSLNKLKLTSNPNLLSKKSSQEDIKVKEAKLVTINIKKLINCPGMPSKIYQIPFKSSYQMERNENVKKLYHQRPDDAKFQLNDINYNLNVHPEINGQLSSSGKTQEKKRNSAISYHLKRSYLSKPDLKNSYRNQIYLPTSGSEKIIQVKRPRTLDCRNSSFYSTTTQQYQSPISKDSSSTATRRIARRSEVIRSEPKQQEYFSKASNHPKLYKQKHQN